MSNLTETAQWEDGIYQIETSDPVLGGPDGISNKQAKLLANRTSFLKQRVEVGAQGMVDHIAASDPHSQYAPTNSPVLTGKPVAPTAVQTSNDTQLATTAFVKAAIAALVASSPAALDTLNELAAALGNDANFAATMTTALAGKQPKDATLSSLSGKDVAGLLSYLGIADNTVPVGIPMPWPLAVPPPGWIKCNGATFTAAQYPKLAAIFTGLQLPDLRGEFIRGWDDGRGVDTGRAMQVSQGDAMRNLDGEVGFVAMAGTTHQSGVLSVGGAQNQLPIGSDAGLTTIAQSIFFNASKEVSTANEFRPRNISFNYIIRAA